MSFDTPINDDNVLEMNEEFTLTVDLSTLPSGVTIGNRGAATVTIVDNDGMSTYLISIVTTAILLKKTSR